MKKLLVIAFAILLVACEKEEPLNRLYVKTTIDNVLIVNGIEYICKANELKEVKKDLLLKVEIAKPCQIYIKFDNGNSFSGNLKAGVKYLFLTENDSFRLLNNEL